MLYVYKNGLNQYLLINDSGNGITSTLGTYNTLADAQTAFNSEILHQQQTTILSWNGAQITDYTTNPPTITNS